MCHLTGVYDCGMDRAKDWVATWPDDSTTSARSATEFLMKLSASQWSDTPYNEMKRQLSVRAQVISGFYINPAQPDDSFIRELFRAGMFELTEEGVKLVRTDRNRV